MDALAEQNSVHVHSRQKNSDNNFQGKKCTILVIDDDFLTRQLLRLVLEHGGYHCREADNGFKGLEILHQESIDAVISDYHMPTMTGLEFIGQMRQAERSKLPPVILMSGDEESSLRHKALKAGCKAFLSKPFETIKILQILHSLQLDQPLNGITRAEMKSEQTEELCQSP